MLFFLTVGGFFLLGYELAARVRLTRAYACERATAALLAGSAIWTAVNWSLALTQQLAVWPLAACGVASLVAGIVLMLRRKPALHVAASRTFLVVAVPLGLWLAYILWRGAILPPVSHDALSAHLPKMLMLVRHHGYAWFPANDGRISSAPCDYELLLTNFLLLFGSDALTEWLGTFYYVVFLVVSGALLERWWGRGRHVAAGVLAIAGMPLLLLQSGAHKNDLMACSFFLAAVVFASRALATRETAAVMLATIAGALGIGTKQHGFLLAAAILGVTAVVLLRQRFVPRLSRIAVWGATAAVAFLLLGGASYVGNFLHARAPVGQFRLAATTSSAPATVGYGDWSNIVAFPVALFFEPFVGNDFETWIPWKNAYWFWPKYELYYSSYGMIGSLLLLALPFGVVACRRLELGAKLERNSASAVCLLTFAGVAPIHFHPYGFFLASLPRYVAFVLPLLVGWTLVPLWRECIEPRGLARTSMAALLLLFVVEAFDCATRDRFAPFDYVTWIARHPGSRVVHFSNMRAAFVVDGVAGPHDTIAVDGALDTWIYPAYGASLSRPVVLLPEGSGVAGVPAEAPWVIVDRSYSKNWGDPRYADVGEMHRVEGRFTRADVLLFSQLMRDPRFELVWWFPRDNQAVFRRVTGARMPPIAPESAIRDFERDLRSDGFASYGAPELRRIGATIE